MNVRLSTRLFTFSPLRQGWLNVPWGQSLEGSPPSLPPSGIETGYRGCGSHPVAQDGRLAEHRRRAEPAYAGRILPCPRGSPGGRGLGFTLTLRPREVRYEDHAIPSRDQPSWTRSPDRRRLAGPGAQVWWLAHAQVAGGSAAGLRHPRKRDDLDHVAGHAVLQQPRAFRSAEAHTQR